MNVDNITCAEFSALSQSEQQTFVIGVANGRGMTSGLFEAYAGAAQDMADSPTEREAIAMSYHAIRALMAPLLTIDTVSLLNGIRSACQRPELQDRMVIEALATVHLEASRALREYQEESGRN